MARLLTHADGRLKTGRVTFLVFVGLLIAMSMLFKVNSSVDQAVLAVKHVFEPAAVESEKRQSPVKPDRPEAEIPKTETVPKVESIVRRNDDEEGKQKAQPVIDRQSMADVKTSGRPGAPTVGYGKDTEGEETPLEPAEQEVKTAVPASPPAETEAARPKREPLPQESPPAFRETEKDLAAVEKEPSPDAPVRQESEGDEVPQPVFDTAGLERLARIGAEESPVKANPGPGRIDVSEKLSRPAAVLEKNVRKSPPMNTQADGAVSKSGHAQADPKTGEVTVDQRRYMALFKSWRSAGSGGKETERIPLRVENLRDSYELFQMKVIAVVRGDTFLDLSDGTRVAEASLAEYCTTLFLVDRPWEKWAGSLASAGVRRDERVEVRYYMYDFIKDAIYGRVKQAVFWCREKGLVAKDLPASSVDVLGKAYVINRQGGGRFGVFVPVSLDTRDGRTVTIDPVCFRGQADVEALRDAGVL